MLSESPKIKLSAIIPNEKVLEELVNELVNVAVDRHQISIQGSPDELARIYGIPYVEPDVIQHSAHAPTQEPFLMDDFGWILAYTLTIPLIIGVIVGVFFVGDLFSVSDNFTYGALGGIVGGIMGLALYKIIKSRRDKKNLKQERRGGFVIWVEVDSKEKRQEIITILNKYHAQHIEKEIGS